MKLLSEYTTTESSETQRGKIGGTYDPCCTLTVSEIPFNWYSTYPEPDDTVQALAGNNPMERFVDLLEEPDWSATALRSGSWDFWKADEEDIYGPEDGHPL